MADVSKWPQHLWKHRPVPQKRTLHNLAWDSGETGGYSVHKLAFNAFLSVSEYHSTSRLICGTHRLSTYPGMLPSSCFNTFQD